MYDQFAGGRARAAARPDRARLRRPGTPPAARSCWSPSSTARVAGAIAAFPVEESTTARARVPAADAALDAAVALAAHALALLGSAGALTPPAPADALYVDALATCRTFAAPRRGERAAAPRPRTRRARAACQRLALDTTLDNDGGAGAVRGVRAMRAPTSRPHARIAGLRSRSCDGWARPRAL